MGGRSRKMRALWIMALALCATAHGVNEVEALEAPRGSGPNGKELPLVERERNDAEFLQMAEQPPADVVGLTSEIKDLQSDISDIKKRKQQSSTTSKAAVNSAAVAAPGAEQDKHMANHIDHGAKEQDLDAQQKQKEQQLVQKTIQQHEAAKKAAVQDAGSSGSADDSGVKTDASGYQGAGYSLDHGSGASGYGTGDASALFDTWTGEFYSTHAKLADEAKRLAGMVASKIQSQRQNVKHHMEVVKKAYEKETIARKTAQQKAKEFQQKESSAKAAEKKAKASEAATKEKNGGSC